MRRLVATIEQAAASIPPPDGQISAEMIPAPAGTAWWPGDPLMLPTFFVASGNWLTGR